MLDNIDYNKNNSHKTNTHMPLHWDFYQWREYEMNAFWRLLVFTLFSGCFLVGYYKAWSMAIDEQEAVKYIIDLIAEEQIYDELINK